jgi:hypothetical protein
MATFAPGDLKIVDMVEHIRKNKDMYLNGAPPTGEVLSARLISDLIWIHALPASVDRRDEWWIVKSGLDWMSGHKPEDVFFSLRADERYGINSYRAEPLIFAFARSIFTCSGEGLVWIAQGALRAPAEFDSEYPGRIVGFAL